jgi:hypothetical protein
MKRVFLIFVGLILAGFCYAETDPKAMPIIQDIQQGRDNANTIKDLKVKATADIGTKLTVGETVIVTPASQNVTNGQASVALKSANLLYGVGQASALTNTITIAAPGTGMTGKYAMIAIGSTSSNVVKIADTSPADMAGDFLMGVGDVLTLWASSATTWVEVSRSNN